MMMDQKKKDGRVEKNAVCRCRDNHAAAGLRARKKVFAQATMEFCFAMVITMLLLMGMIQIVVWSGKDLAERRLMYETTLTNSMNVLEETRPTFYYSYPMSSTVRSDIFGNTEF